MPLGEPHHNDDLAAALAAARELGPDYDKAVASGVVERISREIDARVDQRVGEIVSSSRTRGRRPGGTMLGLGSLVLGIPISAIAGSYAHGLGLAIAWGGIALVNLAAAIRRIAPRQGRAL
jgi:hypothetical protein